jgi:6-phospho-3-hexuloisomerase
MAESRTLQTQILAEIEMALRAVPSARSLAFCELLRAASTVYVAGKGRVGLQMRAFAMRLMHLGVRVHMVGDTTVPAIHANDLLVIGSLHGRLPALKGYGATAKAVSARLVVITAARTPLSDEADLTIHLGAPANDQQCVVHPMVSVQPMASVFEQALGIWLDAVVLHLMRATGVSAEEMAARHTNLE